MKNSKIEWCHHTFNPWKGCMKVSPACDNCYAENWANRFKQVQWGGPRIRTRDWSEPYRFDKEARESGERIRVFSGSLCDIFDNKVPEQWRNDLFRVIADTPHLDWLLLTKRIGNARSMMHAALENNGLPPLANIWLGATVCNQTEADRDIYKLQTTPAQKRFLSIEPLLGPIDLSPYLKTRQEEGRTYPGIDWVIVGGESGLKARPMHPDWARSLRDQCKAAGVPFFFKQWGECVPYEWHAQPPFLYSQNGDLFDAHHLPDFESDDPKYGWISDNTNMMFYRRVGKKKAGSLLDGIEYKEVPA